MLRRNGHDQMHAEYVCGTVMVETYSDTTKRYLNQSLWFFNLRSIFMYNQVSHLFSIMWCHGKSEVAMSLNEFVSSV